MAGARSQAGTTHQAAGSFDCSPIKAAQAVAARLCRPATQPELVLQGAQRLRSFRVRLPRVKANLGSSTTWSGRGSELWPALGEGGASGVHGRRACARDPALSGPFPTRVRAARAAPAQACGTVGRLVLLLGAPPCAPPRSCAAAGGRPRPVRSAGRRPLLVCGPRAPDGSVQPPGAGRGGKALVSPPCLPRFVGHQKVDTGPRSATAAKQTKRNVRRSECRLEARLVDFPCVVF